jgi:hypothetical protein
MTHDVTPFRIETPEADLDDLRRRLASTRWPEAETVNDWSQGVPLAYLRELCRYWAETYDWRVIEARLNALPQFRTEIEGLGIHFVHVRSPHPDALPLVITNGWPGSIVEYLKVIGPLTDPTAHGGDAADAFHVVCPTLPGYGYSDKPTLPGWNVQRIAGAWAALMARLNPPIAAPDPATFDDLTETERATLVALKHAQEWESGYSAQQSTKPQTIGYPLLDSPAGLCAWIIEKFHSWTDSDGDPEQVLTREELLDNVTLYWLTATAASSARLYWESFRQVSEWFTGTNTDTVNVPTGCSIFPKDIPRPSRRWAAKRYTDIRYWVSPRRVATSQPWSSRSSSSTRSAPSSAWSADGRTMVAAGPLGQRWLACRGKGPHLPFLSVHRAQAWLRRESAKHTAPAG